ncbi:hypothetical protein [Tardiphaga sp.]|jgi:hypothetical protein|uniref:hypothetical protein n=1 Tax=Tardiphaga sp. TaxID=1926292 RepID=UPI0037D99619
MSHDIVDSSIARIEITQVRFHEQENPLVLGPLQYMVTLIEEGEGGGELGLWYGDEHADALQAAKTIPERLGLRYPIVDRTVEETLQ